MIDGFCRMKQGGSDDRDDEKPCKTRGGAGERLFAGGDNLGRAHDLARRAVAVEDGAGRSLAGDFDGQVREIFARLGRTLEEAGARLSDMVTMTVVITDPRLGDRFVQLRKEIFGDNFPASALITVAGLARPEMLVEVQGVAVAEETGLTEMRQPVVIPASKGCPEVGAETPLVRGNPLNLIRVVPA